MPRYFFDLLNGAGLTQDDEGAELRNQAAARERAIREARCIMADEVLRGQLDLSGKIVVRSNSGEVLQEIGFDEALRVLGPAAEASR